MNSMIYLDHAATTPCDPRVAEQMAEDLCRPCNPNSVHSQGQLARRLLEEAREELAGILGVGNGQVVFTSSATESNNLALRGLVDAGDRPRRILSSMLEHSCIRQTASALERMGKAQLTLMPVRKNGQAILPDPREGEAPDILCLMYSQNETGVIQQLEEAREFRARTGCHWLCDITQALGSEKVDQQSLGADFLSMASHKVYGPPGVGALAGPGLSCIAPQITGGPQENEMRAGTQPLALIRGFVLAAKLAADERDKRRAHMAKLEEVFLGKLNEANLEFYINGDGAPRLSGFLNISFKGYSAADLVIALDMAGICVSSGSACSSGVMEASVPLAAMYTIEDREIASAAIRITPGMKTKEEDMIKCAEALSRIARLAKRG